MCIVQIGELVGQLSDEMKRLHPAEPWRTIKDTRKFMSMLMAPLMSRQYGKHFSRTFPL